ncbi:hypothetical protein K443DRAFT_673364 [Laccaria amethystina LaAM-08-1]|uniref:Unplaced genomic scaffold K443scaffold_12, whole genome shotgun sequence n=1 Tax=Laccaria amethystina LaAM-08-1 TaxID=1095629 RepID=A0A0C9Y0M1_9AGAR|nr:hypothetical protein K443DRAFT_673364 [Laccaria amethystina LaAM-08-1]
MSQGPQSAMNGYHPNTSSNSYSDFPPPMNTNQQPFLSGNIGVHHQPQPMHHMPQNWNPPPQIDPRHQLPPQHHPFNQSPWPNPMNPQPFSNGMPGMAGFNLPFLPHQVLHDAFSLSAPVEAADESSLVKTLLSSKRKGETYKEALNSLHGKNGHSASLWKDYYLDHKDRLDAWIAMCMQKEKSQVAMPQEAHRPHVELFRSSIKTTKKPSPASFKLEQSPGVSSSASVSVPAKQPRHSEHSTPPIQLPQPSGSRRSTINSLTAPTAVFGGRLPAPNSEIRIPDPPSRSPSPPTIVIPKGRGNKYTQEDRDFFIRFVGWRLKGDPSLTRNDICNLLAEKAPHHSAQSWASHWSNNHDIPDKILAAAKGDNYESGSETESREEKDVTRRKPKYCELSTESEESGSENEGSNEGSEEQSDEDDEDDGVPPRHWEERHMGTKGSAFTEADLYVTAQYIVSFPDWDEASSKDRWTPFSEKFPQRSAKSWGEYYRRYEHDITKLVRKIRKLRVGETSAIHTQCARPTRTPPRMKRKFHMDDDGSTGILDRAKRAKDESES